MRLAGYLNALKENSFAIPVYTDRTDYYFHNVDSNYKIIGFYKVENNNLRINECYLSNSFKINEFGAYVFIGRNNYLNYNVLSESIYEVDKYLYETTDKDKFLSIKEDVDSFAGCLGINNKIVFTVLDDVSIEDVLNQRAFERRKKMKSFNNDLWVNFSGEQDSINTDISSVILEDYIDKFTNQFNSINRMLENNNELKSKLIEYLSNYEVSPKIKELFDVIHLDATCSIKSLKDYNHNFKNSKQDFTVNEGGMLTFNLEDIDNFNKDNLRKEIEEKQKENPLKINK